MNFQQLAAHAGFARLCRRKLLLRQWDAELGGNSAHRFRKSTVLDLLHKTENITRSSATKAVIELLARMH